MRRNSEKDKKLADDERLLCAWRAWHAEELTEALAGPHRHVLEPLMHLLKNLDLHSGNALVDFIRNQNWHDIDADTKLIVLHEINAAITRLRTRNGMEPIADALPGERDHVFQAIRLMIIPPEGKPAAGRISGQIDIQKEDAVTEELRTEKLPAVADAPRVDGFAGFEDEVEGASQPESRGVIRGTCVKFTNEATWVTSDDEELPAELELIVVDIGRVVQRWKDGQPIETIVLAPGQKYPDVNALNEAVPKDEWAEGPDGKPRGPWQAQFIVYLLNGATMDRYTYPTGTTGGAIAIRDLVDRVTWMRRFRGQHVYPLVALRDVFMPTRFGGRQRPHFNIKRWVKLGDDGTALPAAETPLLTDQGAQEVKAPTAKEATGDEIRF
jgi:hypothetical protein